MPSASTRESAATAARVLVCARTRRAARALVRLLPATWLVRAASMRKHNYTSSSSVIEASFKSFHASRFVRSQSISLGQIQRQKRRPNRRVAHHPIRARSPSRGSPATPTRVSKRNETFIIGNRRVIPRNHVARVDTVAEMRRMWFVPRNVPRSSGDAFDANADANATARHPSDRRARETTRRRRRRKTRTVRTRESRRRLGVREHSSLSRGRQRLAHERPSHDVAPYLSIRGAQSHSFGSYYRYFRSKSDVYGYEIYCYA